jgi:hypothetical protein
MGKGTSAEGWASVRVGWQMSPQTIGQTNKQYHRAAKGFKKAETRR